jgi:nucleotide-binding universal stress UspA family protein
MAFSWYAKHIHVPGMEVICFHLGEMPHISPVEAYGLAADAYEEALEGCKETAKRVQDKFVEKMKQNSMKGRVLVKFGTRPGEAIVDISRAEEVSLIVIGTRGLGTLRRTILGSVSDYVLHHANCPVIVCTHEMTKN